MKKLGITMKVKNIRIIELEEQIPVYDISVPETENFCLGNGCVVHNSKDVADAMVGCYTNMMKVHAEGELYTRHKQMMRSVYTNLGSRPLMRGR